MAFEQGRFVGKPVAITAGPTCCSGSRATVRNGTGGRRLPFTNGFPGMSTSAAKDSGELRQHFLGVRRSMDAEARSAASDTICRKLIRSRLFARSDTIAVYFAADDEVDLSKFLDVAWRCKKQVLAPLILRKHRMLFSRVTRDSKLRRNRYGIWEAPDGDFVSPRDLDWVLTPVVVFDAALHRIGMGGGYYDRAFAFRRHRHRSIKPQLTGVAFACQETGEIAANPWDIGVSRIVTET